MTAKVQPYPGIVSKFFPAAATSQFCNKWMGQESFTERLNKSALDPRKEVLELVDERLGEKIPDTAHESKEARRFTTDSSWSFNGPIFSIHCVLPSEHCYFGSASLTIRQPNLKGLIVALKQKWMLENMLGNAGEPLESACRPFYVGKGILDHEEHTIDLGNCRMSIPAHGIASLVSTIDELSSAYFAALRKLDNKWGIDRFPYVRYGNIYIALGVVSKALWNEILRFSRDHDYKKGHTEWHIFDSAPGSLKPFTRNKQPKYNNGYHGIFYAKPINGLSHENELIIMWQPPGHFGHSISNEGWWSCNQAYSWFRSLLPEVGKRWTNCQLTGFDRLFRRNTESHKLRAHWAEVATMRDVRVQQLCENENYNHVGLCETLSILQGFYNRGGHCSRAYFTKAQVTALYKAASLLVEGAVVILATSPTT